MAPTKNPTLAKKIANLRLPLAPLVPLPSGPPHPAFPKTLLAYHLLTEDELDSIAHYYHQSTPRSTRSTQPGALLSLLLPHRGLVESNPQHQHPRSALSSSSSSSSNPPNNPAGVFDPARSPPTAVAGTTSADLSHAQRVAIKRRKVGKFIGLAGMETPVEEVEGRVREAMERALRLAREEWTRTEEWDFRSRRKMA
ncbi:hypothetical protein H2203_004272 [Taxawa tesnikishii (nom. ined.)]|nr:hypothetical protein H2203_004272 [Dothideales sp. JES 119]